MKNTITIAKQLALIFVVLLVVNSCQKDDALTLESKVTLQQGSTTKTVSASEIPKVMQFLESKCNNRLEFIIDDSNSELGMHRSHEENLSMTTALTDQIKMVTNNYGKSNYTFTLIEEQTKEGVYFLNLVVKEYKDELYMYIIKYVPDVSWLSTYKGETSLNNFSGAIYLYNEEGTYVGKVDMVNGMSSVFTKHPCDGDGGGEENDTDHIDNNSGGAGNSGDGTESSGESGSGTSSSSSSSTGNSSSTGDSGGSGGWDIFVIFDCCWCQGQLVGEHDHVVCTAEIVVNLSANTDVESGNIILGGRSLRDVLRHPCDEAPEECFDAVGDPCTHGCDADGNCVDDSEEIENSGIGIDIDLGEVLFTSFVNTLTEEQQQFLEDNPEIEEEIFLFLEENGFSDEAEAFVEEALNDINLNIEDYFSPYSTSTVEHFSINLLSNVCVKNMVRYDFVGDGNLPVNAGLINQIRYIFDQDSNVTLVFRESSDVPEIAFAATDFDLQANIDSGVYKIIITLSEDYLNGNPTKLSIASVLIHEMVHAKLMYSYLQGNLLEEYPQYTDLNDKFQIFLDNRTEENAQNLEDAMHLAMIDFIGTMSYSLYKYAQHVGMDNITQDYCKDIIKGGFNGTPAMNLIDTGESTIEELITKFTNEANNTDEAQGDDC